MSQPIQAVRTSTPPHGAVAGAADAALVLIQAGGNPDGELVRLLTELREAAESNKSVYEQASEAVNKATALQADIARSRVEANDAIAAAQEAARENLTAKDAAETALQLGTRVLEDDRKTFEDEARGRRQKMDDRARILADKAQALETQKSAQTTLAAQLGARESTLVDGEAVLALILSDLKGLLARAEEIG